jgi:hypothetical protein
MLDRITDAPTAHKKVFLLISSVSKSTVEAFGFLGDCWEVFLSPLLPLTLADSFHCGVEVLPAFKGMAEGTRASLFGGVVGGKDWANE